MKEVSLDTDMSTTGCCGVSKPFEVEELTEASEAK